MDPKKLYKVLREKLKEEQSRNRFEHSVSVGDLAAKLGAKYGWNPDRARLTGLLHDCVKEWKPKKLKRYARKNKLRIPAKNVLLQISPNMLHAYVGADFVKKQGWIRNSRDLRAISSHTLGRPGMTIEEKILFVSDFSEPKRRYKTADDIRKIAMKDLDKAFRETLAAKIARQLKNAKPIHPLPVVTWNKMICRVHA